MMQPTRVLVCGSRTFADTAIIHRALDVLAAHGPIHVIVGGARGADSIAEAWARRNGVPGSLYRANWDAEGKAAGHRRNERMLHDGEPDLVVAFVDKPIRQSIGTANMVRIASAAGVRCMIIGDGRDGSHADDGLYQVQHKGIAAGFAVEHGEVTDCAPVLRKRLDWWRTQATRVG